MRPAFICTLLGITLFFACKSRRESTAESNSIFYSSNIRPLTEAIQKDTANAEAWYRRGLSLHGMKQDSLALNDWYHAAALDTNRAEYASAIGDLLFEHKDVSNAAKWLERALRHNPNDIKAHLKIAKLMLFTKEYPKAFSEINTVLRQDAFNPEAYFLKGLVYKDIKDTDKAISCFHTALSTSPDYREAAIQLGQLYTLRKNDLGLQFYEKAFKIDTSDVFPLYAKAMYYQAKNDYEAAKAEYTRCIEHDTQYADAYFGMGFVLLQQDSLEKARRQFDHVTRIEPGNARAYYNRGLCSELMGDKDAAAADYRQALTFDEHYATAVDGLARVRR
jgi:tetratricopeptide (TPR) repeat protein